MSRSRLTLSSAPASEPVSTPDMKTFLRVDASDEDTLIGDLVKSARSLLDGKDGILGRALILQTWTLKLDRFPAYHWRLNPDEAIEIPLPPLQSVSSIQYVDNNGDTQTLATSVYTVDTDSHPGRVFPAYEQDWPETRDIPNAITVTFVAGYGANASDLPEALVLAVKHMVSNWYENREPFVLGQTINELPMGVRALLRPYLMP